MKHTLIALPAVILFSFCSHKVYDRLSWQKSEVQVDGSMSEWSNPLKYFDAKSKLNFTITNDRKNLYICIKAADDESQMKILRGGMDFSIDTASKKTFPVTVTFPLPRTERAMKPREQREGNEERRAEQRAEQTDISRKEAIIKNCNALKLSGFSVEMSDNLPLNNPYGITPALGIDKNDVMVYELTIPFKTFYKEELSPADSNTVFSYRIKVRGIVMQQHAGGGNAGSGMGAGGGMGGSGMGGGMGGMGGGGMGGGMRGGGGGGHRGGGSNSMAASNPMAETDVVQFKAKFSYR